MPVPIRRTLLIGLGGTGVRALQYIKGEFQRNFGFVPSAVRMLAIDTDVQADTSGLDRPVAQLDRSEFMHVVVRGVREFVKAPELQEWILPEHKLSFQDINRGAGQRRVTGRIAFFSRAADIRQRLESIYVDLLGIGAEQVREESEEIMFTDIAGQDEAEVEVYMVCSLAGGTGSGMLLDMGYILREILGLEKHRIIGMFLLPKVFSRSVDASDYVEGNGYASLKELNYWMTKEEEVDIIYPRSLTVKWGGCNYRKPFDLVYLIDDINEAGFRVRDMDTLQNFCARGLFLHMTIESQSVESFWRNLEQILVDEPDWKGQRPLYVSMGLSTLEVPVVRSVELSLTSKSLEVLDQLVPPDGDLETELSYDSLRNQVESFVQEQELNVDTINVRLEPDQTIAVEPHNFERLESQTPTDFNTWLDYAGRRLNEDIAKSLNTNNASYRKLLSSSKEKVASEIARLTARTGSYQAGQFLALLSNQIESEIRRLRDERSYSEGTLSKPDPEKAFSGFWWTLSRRIRQLERDCYDFLEEERESLISRTKLDLTIDMYSALRAFLRNMGEEILPSFERNLRHVKSILQKDLSKIQRMAFREPFTETLGTDLLQIDLKAIRDLIDLPYVQEQWKHSRWALSDKLLTGSEITIPGLLLWGSVPPEEFAEWLKLVLRRRYESVLGESVDERLSALWANDRSRALLRDKIDRFIGKANALWLVSPPHDRVIRYHILFGIAEREDGSAGFLRRVLEDRDSGISLLTVEGREMPAPVFANTWEKYNFRALRIAVPAAAYALEHMRGYREKYIARESVSESRFSHHIVREWMGVDGLPDLFPE